MKKDRLDQWIKEVLQEEGERIAVLDRKEDIIRACKEAGTMRKINFKKSLAMIAVACVLCAGSAIAGGKVVSLVSDSTMIPLNVKSYDKIERIEKKAGLNPRTVDKFQNGFAFSQADLGKTKGIDEKGNKVMSYPELYFSYTKGKETIDLSIQAASTIVAGGEKKNETEYGDITLHSYTDPYKFVPVGYQMTKEEEEQVKKGELYISSGSDKVEYETFVHVAWEENGVSYMLHTMDDYTEADLIEMAKDMIDNGK